MSIGLRRGIVEQVLSQYEYKVRVINYDLDASDPTKTLTADLETATVAIQPGTTVSYNEGDRVVLGFNKDELTSPVILGAMSTALFPVNDDQIKLPAVEEAVKQLQETVSSLTGNNLYTHVKYSNDQGLTLTSLYEYTNLKSGQGDTGQVSYITGEDIEINPKSKTVYWSVIDVDNTNVTNKCTIETTLKAYNYDSEEQKFVLKESQSFEESIIEIPLRLKNFDDLRIDFKIVNSADFKNYHFVLTTDLNEVGSVQGEWMGICISTDPVAPDDPSKYAWTSFKNVIENLLGLNVNDLTKRIEANEKALRGKIYGQEISDGTGLLDGIAVTSRQIDIHGTDNKDVVFDINKSIWVDNKSGCFNTNELRHTTPASDRAFVDMYGSDNHLTMIVRTKNK